MENVINEKQNARDYISRYYSIIRKHGLKKAEKSQDYEELLGDIENACWKYLEPNDTQEALGKIKQYINEYGIDNFEMLHTIFSLLSSKTSMKIIYQFLKFDKQNLDDVLPYDIDIRNFEMAENVLTMDAMNSAMVLCEMYHKNKEKAKHLGNYWRLKNSDDTVLDPINIEENMANVLAMEALADYNANIYIPDIFLLWEQAGYNSQIEKILLSISTIDEEVGKKFAEYYAVKFVRKIPALILQKKDS